MTIGWYFVAYVAFAAESMESSNLRAEEQSGVEAKWIDASLAKIQKQMKANEQELKRRLDGMVKSASKDASPKIAGYKESTNQRVTSMEALEKDTKKTEKGIDKSTKKRQKTLEELKEENRKAQEQTVQWHDDVGREIQGSIKKLQILAGETKTKMKESTETTKDTMLQSITEADSENSEKALELTQALKAFGQEEEQKLKKIAAQQKEGWNTLRSGLKGQASTLRSVTSEKSKVARNVDRTLQSLSRGVEREENDRNRDIEQIRSHEQRVMDKISSSGAKAFGQIVKAGKKDLSKSEKDAADEFGSVEDDVKRVESEGVKNAQNFEKEAMKELMTKKQSLDAAQSHIEKVSSKFEEGQRSAQDEVSQGVQKIKNAKRQVVAKFQSEEQKLSESLQRAKSDMNAKVGQTKTKMQNEQAREVGVYEKNMDNLISNGESDILKLKSEGDKTNEKLTSSVANVKNALDQAGMEANSLGKEADNLQREVEKSIDGVNKKLQARMQSTKGYVDEQLSPLPDKVSEILEVASNAQSDVSSKVAGLESHLKNRLSGWVENLKEKGMKDLEGYEREGDESERESDNLLSGIKEHLDNLGATVGRMADNQVPNLKAEIESESSGALEKIEAAKAKLGENAGQMGEELKSKVVTLAEKQARENQLLTARTENTLKENGETLTKTKDKISEKLDAQDQSMEKSFAKLQASSEDITGRLSTAESQYQQSAAVARERRAALEKKRKELLAQLAAIEKKSRDDLLTEQGALGHEITTKLGPVVLEGEAKARDLAALATSNSKEIADKVKGSISSAESRLRVMKQEASEATEGFNGEMKDLKGEFGDEQLAARKMSTTLQRDVKEDEKELRLKEERRNQLLSQEERQLVNMRDGMTTAVTDARNGAVRTLTVDAQRARGGVKQNLAELLGLAAESERKGQARLQGLTQYQGYETGLLNRDMGLVARDVSGFNSQVGHDGDYLTKDMTQVGGKVNLQQVSEQKDIEVATGRENQEFNKELGVAEKLLLMLKTMETSTGTVLSEDASNWAAKKAAATEHLSASTQKTSNIVGMIQTTLDDAKKRSAAALGSVTGTKKNLEHDLSEMSGDMEKKVSAVQNTLSEESARLKENAKQLQGLIEGGLEHVGGSIQSGVEQLAKTMTDAQGALEQIKAQQQTFDSQLTKAASYEHNHEMGDIEALDHDVAMLELLYTQLSTWGHGWQKHDLAWKRLVGAKMKELGIEISDDQLKILEEAAGAYQNVQAVEGQTDTALEGDMAKQRSVVNQELADIMSNGDKKIAEILADKQMSDAEKNAAIRKIQEENQEQVSRMFSAQKSMQMNQQMLEGNIAKYANMVDEAVEATKRAQGEGVLTQKSADFYDQMGNVANTLNKLKGISLDSSSLIQTSESDSSTLHNAKKALELEDDALQREDGKLSMKISQLRKALHGDRAVANAKAA